MKELQIMNDIIIENGNNSVLGSDGMHYPNLKYDIIRPHYGKYGLLLKLFLHKYHNGYHATSHALREDDWAPKSI